jgi:hypothetical protein
VRAAGGERAAPGRGAAAARGGGAAPRPAQVRATRPRPGHPLSSARWHLTEVSPLTREKCQCSGIVDVRTAAGLPGNRRSPVSLQV